MTGNSKCDTVRKQLRSGICRKVRRQVTNLPHKPSVESAIADIYISESIRLNGYHPMHKNIELFLSMLEECNSKIPEPYRDKYPGILIRVLLVLNASPCLSQTEVAQRLGVQQSRFCKLAKKLGRLHLIDAVISDKDHRFDELKITKEGIDWLDSLEPGLLTLLATEQTKHERSKQE